MPYRGPIDRKAARERRAIAARLLRQGVPVAVIARQLGISTSYLYDLRKQLTQREEVT